MERCPGVTSPPPRTNSRRAAGVGDGCPWSRSRHLLRPPGLRLSHGYRTLRGAFCPTYSGPPDRYGIWVSNRGQASTPPPSVSGSVHDWQRSAHENKQNILRSASRNSQDPSGVYGAEVPAPQEQKSLSDGDGGTGGPGGARSRPDDRHPQSCHHPFKGWRSWKEW